MKGIKAGRVRKFKELIKAIAVSLGLGTAGSFFGIVLKDLGLISNKLDFEVVLVEMRDGVRLRTRVWKPDKEGQYPVVLERGYKAGLTWLSLTVRPQGLPVLEDL